MRIDEISEYSYHEPPQDTNIPLNSATYLFCMYKLQLEETKLSVESLGQWSSVEGNEYYRRVSARGLLK